MTEHSLRTAAPYWHAINVGQKRFVVRRDDRGFQRGDVLLLRRLGDGAYAHMYATDSGVHSDYPENAQTIRARVDWILTGGQLGVEPGFVVMSITVEH
jgi:hypothetical protein